MGRQPSAGSVRRREPIEPVGKHFMGSISLLQLTITPSA